jgi:hypothetical protein
MPLLFGLGIPHASLCIMNLSSSQAQLVWDTYCTQISEGEMSDETDSEAVLRQLRRRKTGNARINPILRVRIF